MYDTWTDLLMADHEQTEQVIEALEKKWLEKRPAADTVKKAIRYFSEFADACHNQKEERHLFPRLSAAGIPRQSGPLGVMLMEHERSKQLLAEFCDLGNRYVAGETAVADDLVKVFLEYGTLLKSHYWKENDILYPMARRVMSEADAAAVVAGIEAVEAALGPDTRSRYYALAEHIIEAGELKDLSFGVERDVLAAILNTLPVELSFVDKDDRVRYFSHEGGEKIFPRTRGAIGTAVQNCHPQKSVHLVNRILADFKAGSRKVAEFWIDMGGRKVHIRYFPVRSPKGEYLGTLEVVQDITPIQALQGQRRLLEEEETTAQG